MTKTVLITGASSGIGKTTALLFAQHGWNVIASMRSPEKDGAIFSQPNIRVVRLDVTSEQSVCRAIAESLEHFGSIDVIVNNAGYAVIGPLEAATETDYSRQFNTNVFGVIRVIQAILPHFKHKRSGTIINISSIAETMGLPFAGLYHATKWAVGGLSESLQYELSGFNIRIKLVMPPGVKTDFFGRSMTVMKKEGLTDYDDALNKSVYRNPQTGNQLAIAPLTVAKVIYRAAIDTSNRLRYPVGMCGAIMLVRRILPARLFYRLVRAVTMRH